MGKMAPVPDIPVKVMPAVTKLLSCCRDIVNPGSRILMIRQGFFLLFRFYLGGAAGRKEQTG